jgi:signal transduction histidine kinase
MTEIYKARKEKEEEKTKRLSAIGELSARIAHDLRNPLSVIKTTVDIIKTKNPSLGEITKGELARMDRAIMRMTHQIDDVLDYVRSKPLQLENRSLLEILYSVLERIAVPSTVSINVSKNDAKISCDPEKTEIVFVNLITNAIQAMNNNGIINIRITEQKDNSVIIEVEDSGPGITDDVLPKIFDPLFTTRQVGTGLGLVSCKSIIERHGGTIDVKTEFGKGTTFIIKLPKESF